MARDAEHQRGERPVAFTSLKTGECVDTIQTIIRRKALLDAARA